MRLSKIPHFHVGDFQLTVKNSFIIMGKEKMQAIEEKNHE